MTKIKVIAYAEQCVESGEDCADFVVCEGTAEELLEMADELDRKYQGHYRFQLAKTIRDPLCVRRPTFTPTPVTDEDRQALAAMHHAHYGSRHNKGGG